MRIYLIAGEASGDLHGAALVRALRDREPGTLVMGIGGSLLAAAGMEIRVDNRDLAVVGISEVISHARDLRRALKVVSDDLARERPDALVLIDFPDFNLMAARRAKSLGLRVVYYIPPQVWAWRKGRLRKIGRRVDRVLTIFPFEEEIYRRQGIPVTFVGHPLVDAASGRPGRVEARRSIGLSEEAAVLALLPGSRRREVELLFPVQLEAARRLGADVPGLSVVVPVAPTVDERALERMAAEAGVKARLSRAPAIDVLAASDAAVVTSGTATLEAAIAGVPFVIVYKVSGVTAALGRLLIGVENIGLVNIVAGRRVVPELLQENASPDEIVRAVRPWLTDRASRAGMERDLDEVRRRLGPPGASARAAEAVMSIVGRLVPMEKSDERVGHA